jgi:hypothetical protein
MGRIDLSVAGDPLDAKAAVLRLVVRSRLRPCRRCDLNNSWRQQPGLTTETLKPLLSGAHWPKLTGAGSPNTAPNGVSDQETYRRADN